MPKINQEEYEILKELDDKWKWIARDGFKDKLNVYNVRPTRSNFKNWWLTNKWFGRSKTILPYFFPFIQWSDSEPYFIPDLIKEYEDKSDVGYALKEFAESLSEFNKKTLTESEEEMKKDKDWLSEQVGDLNSTDAVFNESGVSYIDTAVSMERVFDLIDQLDDPEVLSQEWIDEHKVARVSNLRKMTMSDVVPVDELQDLLVPKQELPVVPTWFDKWWKDVTKGGGNLFHNIERFYDELFSSGTREVYNYISSPDNKKKLLNIIVNELEYEVEKEQKYYVLDKEDATLLKKSAAGEGVAKSVGTNIYNVKSWKDEEKYQLTEQEIKDYDERFWAFAVPVEEAQND